MVWSLVSAWIGYLNWWSVMFEFVDEAVEA